MKHLGEEVTQKDRTHTGNPYMFCLLIVIKRHKRDRVSNRVPVIFSNYLHENTIAAIQS